MNEELADLLERLIMMEYPRDDKPVLINAVKLAAKRLRGEWIPIDKFLENPVEGLCHVHYFDGETASCVYSIKGQFCNAQWPYFYPMFEGIIYVMPIKTPEPLQ